MRSLKSLLVLLVLALPGCAGLPILPEVVTPPEVSLANFELLDSTLMEQRFRITLRVQNPNPFPLPLVGFNFGLAVNGREFADGANNTSTLIPQLGEQMVTVDGTASMLQVAQIVLGLPGRDTLDYGIDGEVFVQRGIRLTVPFSETGELRVPSGSRSSRLYENAT